MCWSLQYIFPYPKTSRSRYPPQSIYGHSGVTGLLSPWPGRQLIVSPIFSWHFSVIALWKVMSYFSCRLLTAPIFPRRLSGVLSKCSHKKIILLGCNPWMVSPEAVRQGRPPPLVTPLYIGPSLRVVLYKFPTLSWANIQSRKTWILWHWNCTNAVHCLRSAEKCDVWN